MPLELDGPHDKSQAHYLDLRQTRERYLAKHHERYHIYLCRTTSACRGYFSPPEQQCPASTRSRVTGGTSTRHTLRGEVIVSEGQIEMLLVIWWDYSTSQLLLPHEQMILSLLRTVPGSVRRNAMLTTLLASIFEESLKSFDTGNLKEKTISSTMIGCILHTDVMGS